MQKDRLNREHLRQQLMTQLQERAGRGDLCESSLRAMFDLLSRETEELSVFHREFFSPGHFTASAFALDPSGRELLLIHHKKLQLWLQPGGHMEEADTDWVAAALRELAEETGLGEVELLDPLFAVDVHSIPAWKDVPAHQHYDVRVLVRARSREIQGGDEVVDARWFPLEMVAAQTETLAEGVATDASVRGVAQKLVQIPEPCTLSSFREVKGVSSL